MLKPPAYVFSLSPAAACPAPARRVWAWAAWSGARPGTAPASPAMAASDHGVARAQSRAGAEEEWEAAMPGYDMNARLEARTAVGLPEQHLLMAINNGNMTSLQSFRGIGPKVAAHIVEYRAQNRFFASLDDLARVPLLGPVRFRQLVGRDSTVLTHPLHSWLRAPLDAPVRRSDLRDRAWVAPGLPRLHLAADEAEEALERERALQAGWTIRVHRVGEARLCFHCSLPQLENWAALLVKHLPACLRKILSSSRPASSSPFAPTP